MATVKVNSRSPYYVVASGADGGTIENASVKIVQVTNTGDKDGPISEIYGTNITLKVVPNNFTPVSYLWSGGSIAGSTNQQIDNFTEPSGVDQTITYGVTATDSAGNTYPAEFKVNWSADAQYEALFQLTDSVVGPSQGYTITGTPALTFNSSTEKYEARITGKDGDSYSFAYSVSVNSEYNQDSTLTFSPVSPITGTFGTSNVTETATLSGTISLDANYILKRSTSNVIEGNTFNITLNTQNVPDGTSVPFTITGIQAPDLQREGLNGSFVIGDTGVSNECVRTFQTVTDFVSEPDETFTLTLNDITPAVSISVVIADSNQNQSQSILISSLGSYDPGTACNYTATEDAYYGLATGQSAIGNGVILYKDASLTQPYTATGDIYKIGTNNIGRISQFNPGEITQYNVCAVTDDEEDIGDTEVEFTCAIADFDMQDGVVGQPVSFSKKFGEITSVSPSTYQFGSTKYTASILVPDGYTNYALNAAIQCEDTATGTSPVNLDCSTVSFSVPDGATGESISYDYSAISASDIVSVKNSSGGTVYASGSDTYTITITVPAGYLNAGTTLTCTDTATGSTTPVFTCTLANFQVVDNGEINTAVQHSVSAGTVVSVTPSVYQRGTNIYTASITIPDGYQGAGGTIDTCTDTATGLIKVSDSNSIDISSQSVDNPGPNGEFACELQADTVAYYVGTIQNGTTLYRDIDRTLVFGGVDKWHRLEVPNSDGEIIGRYARVGSYINEVNNLSQCGLGTDSGSGVGEQLPPTVNVTASNSDSNEASTSFIYQKTTLTVTTANITGDITYQWYKGTFADGGTAVLSPISGEITDTLVINEIGGGGETQTTTGQLYYNCLVSNQYEDDLNRGILWDSRSSFTLRFASTNAASDTACSSATTVTIWGDRNSVTSFCVGNQFYSNEQGNSSPSLSAGTYSTSTNGTNGDFRYIESNGVAAACVNGGCEGVDPTPDPAPVQQRLLARRCQGQDSAGVYEYFRFDGFQYANEGDTFDNILDIGDVSQSGGRGCYETIETYADDFDFPGPYFNIVQSDIQRQQPYGTCQECIGQLPAAEVPEEPEITFYYARFIDCGQSGGTITGVVSTSQISTNLVIKTNNVCKEYLDDVQVSGPFDLSSFTTFFGCDICQASLPQVDPTPTLSFFRAYGDCATGGSDILKSYGSFIDLGSNYPAVINDNGVCMQDLGQVGLESEVNVANLTTYSNCADCNEAVNPTPEPEPEPTPTITKFRVASASWSSASTACSNPVIFDVKVAYSGTLGDGTRLYTNDTLTTLYTPTSTNFVKSDAGAVFRIGVNNPGEVSNYVVC